MFNFPFGSINRLPYAETHYKFKLPWAPLHKKWPEVFVDGPSFCIPGIEPIFYLVIKDADYFPIQVNSVEVQINGPEGRETQSFPFNFSAEENLRFITLPIRLPKTTGDYTLHCKIHIEKKNGSKRIFLNGNFPGMTMPSLQVKRLAHALPYPAKWFAGELHCHSNYSNDPVEYGAPLEVLQQAGAALGLSFIGCTDHSYDFYYQKERYMERTDPFMNFQNYRREALTLNEKNPHYPTLIPGEEVSCANDRGENVHMLVMGHSEFIPGLGDGGRRWFDNKPDLKISQVLDRIGKIPAFAAHPKVQVGRLEKMIFRRGMWHEKDLQVHGVKRNITGLQFWNGHRGKDFSNGRAFWVQELLSGKRLLPIGASDAHGDLNQNIGVKIPLFSLYHSRNHVLGSVRTLVKAENKSMQAIHAGIHRGDVCATDGPFLSLHLENEMVKIIAHSTPDFGELQKIHLFLGKLGSKQEVILKTWEFGSWAFHIEREWPIAQGLYLRAEGWTSEKKLAITAPYYLD